MGHKEADAYARGRGRLEALRRYEILDTEAEEAFDRLVRLAAQICGAPSSTITLVDEERQWFKARLRVDLAETGLDESFCKFAICGTEVMEVPDARSDERFADYPNVVGEPKIRFYAGAPLVTPEGHRLGTICVFDTESRAELSAKQRRALSDLAGVVVDELELRRARRELMEKVDREQGLKEALLERQERLDLALEASNLGLWEWVPGGETLWINERGAEQLGVVPGELSVAAFIGRFVESSRGELDRIFGALLEDQRCARLGILQVDRGDEASCDLRWVVVYAARGSESSRDHVIGTLQDITEARNGQLEMEKLERLAAVGTMAAGVGHEINNPLAYILASMEFVQGMLGPLCESGAAQVSLARTDVAEALSAINDAHEGALRMRDIVRELRILARDPKRDQPAEPVAIDESLNLALRMARIHLRGMGRMELERASSRQVLATRSGLTQVLLNLLLNAVHAVTQKDDEQRGRVVVRTLDREDQVIIEIEDNGVGIARENLPRVFDPFFTTKGPDEGTGLGLSTSVRLVEQFGGRLELSSEEGEGTLVRLTLPAVALASTSGANKASSETALHRVLVVDDEVRLGKMFVRLLRDQAEVVSVEGVEKAWEALDSGDFDVIFCDLHLPLVSGATFYRELSRERPELARRVVFMTGGLYSDEARELVASSDNVVLYKPFDLAALRKALASALARAKD
ncbi:response regulator [Lujinxingia vulgaris]|uniref:histidine kinase n=1 Tax=Lujinxingia vulgaris TaxID=2600176 RepID=A0A5C6XD76_9DELT|nr:ATP-binding protein [Lujinxingia vulgaris]TXD37231.1 response regulator [Lujinxingia vulgaris]